MAGAIESESFEEERLQNERETMTWKPRKERLLKNIPGVLDGESEESEFSDTSHNESDTGGSPVCTGHAHSDLEDLDGELSNMSVAVTYPELQTAAAHEVEDWDKELEDYDPYDAGDFHCGSFQENNPLASYSWQEDSFYVPSCHHAASLAFKPPFRMTETGQFDDADE
ncbi:coordinator of PRMT5 and differentiation stimulator isoform X2 [Neopsephotus bourkii]|uniref:coordinator of PRMT5 and differentiation stimulator isoform X2 n=1 Tax=Neopsephotus bourkii TaxID=309878 RepID=UPI002AA513CA|nr:coordinator of PRMT5 and differentiation stimulator isoform X2 [Neopsephotus bourkii]